MEQFIPFFQNFGLAGLFILSFIESFISPILPDLMLIPMALAQSEKAIMYSVVATVGSVLGGFVGYGIGMKFGIPVMKRFVPQQQADKIHGWIENYGGWAIFLAALAPIPYKFVSISAGVFRINMVVFVIASIFGRGKRFILEGVLIYYYGAQAVELIKELSQELLIGFVLLMVVIVLGVRVFKKHPQKNLG